MQIKLYFYLQEWPSKHPEITVRQLVSHLSGIRHYSKKSEASTTESNLSPPALSANTGLIKCTKEKEGSSNEKAQNRASTDGSNDSEFPEFLLNKKFQSVSEALEIFKNDELLAKPGETFLLIIN